MDKTVHGLTEISDLDIKIVSDGEWAMENMPTKFERI